MISAETRTVSRRWSGDAGPADLRGRFPICAQGGSVSSGHALAMLRAHSMFSGGKSSVFSNLSLSSSSSFWLISGSRCGVIGYASISSRSRIGTRSWYSGSLCAETSKMTARMYGVMVDSVSSAYGNRSGISGNPYSCGERCWWKYRYRWRPASAVMSRLVQAFVRASSQPSRTRALQSVHAARG